MKKILLIFLACFCCACTKKGQNVYMEPNGKTKVLSSVGMIDDLVGFVGGKEIDHVSLIQGEIDPHSYELVKGDGEKIMHADVVFFIGLGLEHGASIQKQFQAHPCAVPLGDTVFERNKEKFVYVEEQVDPHIWMDISLFVEVVDPIVDTLGKADPDHAALFAKRGKKLKERMVAKDRELCFLMQKIPDEKRFLVTSHDAFHYFTKKYLAHPSEKDWDKRIIAPEGLAPDGQMGVQDIKAVADFLCEHDIHVVFPESNINQDSLKKIVAICQEKGLHVKMAAVPLYGDTMGRKGAEVASYLDMIEHNVHTLIQNLGQQDYGDRSPSTDSQL